MADLQSTEKRTDENTDLSLEVVKRGQSDRRIRNIGV
jgi:hypothetical protein